MCVAWADETSCWNEKNLMELAPPIEEVYDLIFPRECMDGATTVWSGFIAASAFMGSIVTLLF